MAMRSAFAALTSSNNPIFSASRGWTRRWQLEEANLKPTACSGGIGEYADALTTPDNIKLVIAHGSVEWRCRVKEAAGDDESNAAAQSTTTSRDAPLLPPPLPLSDFIQSYIHGEKKEQ